MSDPHSIEAEQSLIGGLLLDNQRMADVADVVRPGDFYRADHQAIFAAMLALDGAGRPFDAVMTAEQLQRDRNLDAAGGLEYLGRLVRETPSAANVRAYALIVWDRAVRRRVKASGVRLQALAASADSAASLVAEAQADVLGASGEALGGEPEHIGEGLAGWLDALDARSHRGDGMVGLSTGLKDLDTATGGLAAGDLIVLAGRPSMGKTACALSIARHVSMGIEPKPALVFSLEQPRYQLVDRVVSDLVGIDHGRIRKGNLEDGDYPRLTQATAELGGSRLYIDDTHSQTVIDLRAKARRVKHKHGLSLVVVDYLQLIHTDQHRDNRATEVAEISRGLKALAKELEVPVLALSQLNRGVESRDDRRPRMSDLRESGAIEQDADVIILMYRQAAYDREFLMPTITELNIGKQRNGPTGMVLAHFLANHMRFRDADLQSIQQYRALLSTPARGRGRARHPDDAPSGRDRAAGDDR